MKTPSFFKLKKTIELGAVFLAVLVTLAWTNSNFDVRAQLPAEAKPTLAADDSAVAAADSRADALFIFSTSDDAAMRDAMNQVEHLDGTLINRFPPSVAWGKLPRENKAAVEQIDGVKKVTFDTVNPAELGLDDTNALIGVDTWNGHFKAAAVAPDNGQPLVNDDLAPSPALDGKAAKRAGEPRADTRQQQSKDDYRAPNGAGFYDTSEFLAGNISIAVILPESTGAIDAKTESWSSTREALVASEMQNGINWWYDREPAAQMSFSYHFYYGRTDSRARTSYEPINRSADPYGATGEDLWVKQIMGNFGYTDSQRLDRVRHFNNDIREADGSDWAVTYFVADSLNDGNGSFADNYFAYMWIGGPYSVLTYDNDGYGISYMDAVAAHEFGHAFYANDQYSSACSCDQHRGYLDYYNYNCENSCPHNVYSIMRGQIYPYSVGAVDMYARGQIGIIDTDRDGIIDVLSTKPSINLGDVSGGVGTTKPVIAASSEVTKVANKNPEGLGDDITVAKISEGQYRVDGGDWKSCEADDGHFNETQENFTCRPTIAKGRHTIEIRAYDNYGNESDTKSIVLSSGEARLITVPGQGGGPQVREFSTTGKTLPESFFAYPSYLRIGARVATADIDKDGGAEIVTGSGIGAQPHVVVYEKNGAKRGVDFRPFASAFRGGVDVAAGDVDGDGKDEVVMSQFTQGNQVKVYRYNSGRQIMAVFSPFGNISSGVTVTTGDVDGDGLKEVICGASVGGGPHVRVYDIKDGHAVLKSNSFFAFSRDSRTGVDVSAGDVNADGLDEIAISQLYNGEAWMKVYQYNSARTVLGSWRAFPAGVECGANVEMMDVDGDGRTEVLVGPNTGGGPQVRAFEYNGQAVNGINFFAYDKNFRGGVVPTGGFF